MTWEMKLITTYDKICSYLPYLSLHLIRMSNNYQPAFTDAEVMTIYCYCTSDTLKLHGKKEIYTYADRHLRSWFPKLPKYEAFNARINALNDSFRLLSMLVINDLNAKNPEFHAAVREFICDSLPIMLAKAQRTKRAKVAREIATSGYCATKKLAYYGFKLHAANLMATDAKLPDLSVIALSSAAAHDNKVFKEQIAPHCRNAKCYADSAYCDQAGAAEILTNFNVTVCPIQKRKKGQKELSFNQKCQNTAISTIRQPIEGFFNWLIELTGIQNAAKCRSTKGVLAHIYAKLAAAVIHTAIFNS